LLLTGGLALHAQPRTVIQTETRLVVVDAVVTGKKGDRVLDLAKKDFHVFEDGKEQPLQVFSFEAPSGGAGAAASDPQRLILFFDNQSLKPTDQVRARHSAASFIDANVDASRLMAVADFDGTLHISQNFTDNPGRLKDAVNQTRYGGITGGANSSATAASSASLSEQNARSLMGMITNLARNLSSMPGRKIIVVLSAGLPVSSDSGHDVEAAAQACNRSNTGVYAIDFSSPLNLASSNTADTSPADAQPARGGMGRGGPVATRGPQAAPVNEQVDMRAVASLAQSTGGFVVRDANDLLRGFEEVGKEQNEYYVLGYTPPESKEGSCHNLRVKVDRGSVNVRARSSYCSNKAQDLLAGSSAAKDLEARAAAAQSGNVSATMQLPFFYIGANVARVRVAMEIVPDALKFETKNGKQHAELNVLGIASTADGDTAARFSDVVKLDVDDRRAPVRYEKEFKIAPGQYKFTVVFSSGGAGFGKLETPLVIEPRDAGAPQLSGIALSKQVHAASDLGLDAGLFEDTTLLIANGVEFVPSPSNQFHKDDLAVFYVELYQPSGAESAIRTRVLDRKSGEQKLDSGLLKLPPTNAPVVPLGQKLPVAELAPGAYTLELTAVSAAGKEFKRTADFELR
jgi:VWFA-related protein